MCHWQTRGGQTCKRQGRHCHDGQIYCLRHYKMLTKENVNNMTDKNKKCKYKKKNGFCKQKVIYKDLCKKHLGKIYSLKYSKNNNKNDSTEKVIELTDNESPKPKKEIDNVDNNEENIFMDLLLKKIKNERNMLDTNVQQPNKSKGYIFG